MSIFVIVVLWEPNFGRDWGHWAEHWGEKHSQVGDDVPGSFCVVGSEFEEPVEVGRCRAQSGGLRGGW